MLYYVLIGHQLCTVVYLLLWFYDFISVKESHWVLLLYATIITGVVVETFPFVWTPPVSSRCHFAFHPHPLVRISAALLWVSVGEYRSLWVMVCNVICACSNTSAHCVVLCSTAAFLGTCHFCFFFSPLLVTSRRVEREAKTRSPLWQVRLAV